MKQRHTDTPAAYDHAAIETAWQRAWEKHAINRTDITNASKPYYNLMMFPYPSAEGLHVGNMYAFTGSDVYGRFKRMQGYDVFEPIGLDGFGIHSENYALKVGKHPADQAKASEKNFFRQLSTIGAMFDWGRTVTTYDPEYYRWTQWLFVQMFKHGLAYRGRARVNWCPGCKTVLADEQVIDERCERCGNKVSNKSLDQWFFKITAYAGKLLDNSFHLNWSHNVKIAQQNWIGKKEGIHISYEIVDEKKNSLGHVTCFTTTPVNFAATFLVLAPEHPFISQLNQVIKKEQLDTLTQYITTAVKKTSEERIKEGRKKTGVFTGVYAKNHVTGEFIPVWVSDFVIMDVGTGAIQGCPGHDMRDFEFATVYGIPIKRVVVGPDGDTSPITSPEQVIQAGQPGTMVNSEFLNGLPYGQAMEKTKDYFEAKGWGKRVTTYHLRDWIISRQRYWGPPIPMIYCEKCAKVGKSWFTTEEAGQFQKNPKHKILNSKQIQSTNHQNSKRLGFRNSDLEFSAHSAGWYPVPEQELPVELPYIKDYKPGDDGVAPLAKHKEFYHVACPGCGADARRETDVSDTFLDSSWYFLRYPSVDAQVGKTFSSSPPSVGSSLVTGAGGPPRRGPLVGVLGGRTSAGPAGSDLRVAVLEKACLPASTNFPWDPAVTKKWLPVDMYTGGAEHSVLHLMYSRFVWMCLYDWGYFDFSAKGGPASGWEEPFTNFFAHGLVIKDGAKMSKSKGNVVTPDEYIRIYGADALRLYLMFMGPFNKGGDFRDTAMEGMRRWLGRVWRMALKSMHKQSEQSSAKIHTALQRAIQKVGDDVEKRRYNTAIATLMEFTNLVADEGGVVGVRDLGDLILMLAPFAPHMTEELWQKLNSRSQSDFTVSHSVHVQKWPACDANALTVSNVPVIIQVNGKHRDTLTLDVSTAKDQTEVESAARRSPKVAKYIAPGVAKVIFLPGKLLNFVID